MYIMNTILLGHSISHSFAVTACINIFTNPFFMIFTQYILLIYSVIELSITHMSRLLLIIVRSVWLQLSDRSTSEARKTLLNLSTLARQSSVHLLSNLTSRRSNLSNLSEEKNCKYNYTVELLPGWANYI